MQQGLTLLIKNDIIASKRWNVCIHERWVMDRLVQYESFGSCLKRILAEMGISASEAARLVGFRSRNSIFRILNDTTTLEVDMRFLAQLRTAAGDTWPPETFRTLEDALECKRFGHEQHLCNRAYVNMLYVREPDDDELIVRLMDDEGNEERHTLASMLDRLCSKGRTEIVITGKCHVKLARLLALHCTRAAEEGRLTIRHYLDTTAASVTEQTLGILPLVGKTWYNARLVKAGCCPEEMMGVYRLNSLFLLHWDEQGESLMNLIRYDAHTYCCNRGSGRKNPLLAVMDQWRMKLALLKPMQKTDGGVGDFVAYTENYAAQESGSMILSIKPDVHFNCVPTALLEKAVAEGFRASGLAAGTELQRLLSELRRIHDRRFDNMMHKRKPTCLVYSLPAMRQFMRTGVQTDQFFIQRAYTVEERRELIRVLIEQQQHNPYFHVHFLRDDAAVITNEITYYGEKGVMITDAFTGYDLHDDHSEVFITHPAFCRQFREFFMKKLLPDLVLSESESLATLEELYRMPVHE